MLEFFNQTYTFTLWQVLLWGIAGNLLFGFLQGVYLGLNKKED